MVMKFLHKVIRGLGLGLGLGLAMLRSWTRQTVGTEGMQGGFREAEGLVREWFVRGEGG